jgi:hypothetical protein
MSNLVFVERSNELWVVQRKELAELVGFETRNKYAIHDTSGAQVAFAAEQGKGFLSAIFRHFAGHWRTFEIHVFDNARALLLRVVHPFRWFFQRIEVFSPAGAQLGAVQQRFAVFSKRFDVEDAAGKVLLSVSSPAWKPWTFAFQRNGQELALVQKTWSGAITELFTDADRFRVVYNSPDLTPTERTLVLAASLFIDLQYFEQKASR